MNATKANERDRRPLSLEQLRVRLKHIAGLCWGLSIDLNNEVTRNEELTAENKRLPARFRSIFRLENNTAQGIINRTPQGTIYSVHFKRWGYDIFATSSSGLTDLKEEFIKAANIADGGTPTAI